MNQKGNLVFFILGAFLLIALAAPLLMYFFKPADWLIRILLVFFIFTTVRSYVGQGMISLVLSAILIYFLVIKYAYITASLYILYVLLGLQFMSVIIWGLGTNLKRG